MTETGKDFYDPMTEQLYIFADAYYYGKGKDRTFKAAAIRAGSPKESAHTNGYRWSRDHRVQKYWEELDKTIGEEMRRLRLHTLLTMQDEASRTKVTLEERMQIWEQILEHTQHAFDVLPGVKREEEESKKENENTLLTINQIVQSVSKIIDTDESEGDKDGSTV